MRGWKNQMISETTRGKGIGQQELVDRKYHGGVTVSLTSKVPWNYTETVEFYVTKSSLKEWTFTRNH